MKAICSFIVIIVAAYFTSVRSLPSRHIKFKSPLTITEMETRESEPDNLDGLTSVLLSFYSISRFVEKETVTEKVLFHRVNFHRNCNPSLNSLYLAHAPPLSKLVI